MRRLRFFSFWSILIALLLFFHTRGFISHDEGWVLNSAVRILDGQVPYRDFYLLYTPGSIFSVTFFFKLFGESILTARILALFFNLISSILIYKITKRISNHAAIPTIATILFLFWGPFQINFVWPVMLAISSGLVTVYFLEESNNNSNFSYFAGFTTGLTLLFKQNFGAAIILVATIAFIFNPKIRTKTKLVNFILGFSFVIGFFVIYLFANNTFFKFIEQMRYLLFDKILIEGMLSSPFIYPDAIYKQAVKLIFYLSPLVISFFSISTLYRSNRKLIHIASFPAFYFLLSIRPTTDLIHLAPLIAITGINFSLVYKYSKAKAIRSLAVLALAFFVFLGAYVITFKGYYRWEAPILSHDIFYKHPKINIFVDQKFEQVLNKVLPELKNSKSDFIFIYHFAPMFYFVSDKKNSTYYDDLQPKLLTQVEQERIVSQLKQSRVDTILTNSNLKTEKTTLTKYIMDNYYPATTIYDYIIYKTNPIR